MKKFLFTLAALLMAGSAFAWAPSSGTNQNDYFYVDDFEFTQTQMDNLGKKTVNVHAQFASYISAFRIKLTLPEGLNVTNVYAGNDLVLSYTDNQGQHKTKEPDLGSNIDGSEVTILVQHMIMDYVYNEDTEEATGLGVAHWAPGYYEQMVRVQFQPSAGFAGGDVTIRSEPSAGGHVGYEPICPQGSYCEGTFHVGVPAAPQPTPAPVPVISLDDNGDVIATAEGHTVQLYLNGNPVDQPYELPAATWETQTLSFTAVTQPNANETATESAEPFVVTIDPLQPTAAPAPVISTNDAGQIIATCDGPNTVQLYLNGVAVDQPYTLPAATWETQTLSFTATTLPGEHETATSTTEPYVVTIDPLQPQPATAPEIVVENGFVTAVAEGHQTVLMLDGQVVNQPYELPAAGEEDVTLHFSAYTIPGEHETQSETVYKDVVVEAAPVVTPTHTCERPNCSYTISGEQEVTVSMHNNQLGATVYYTITLADGTVYASGSFTEDDFQTTVQGIGVYTVTCWAHIDDPDWADSPDGGCFFEIKEDTGTGINELVNGKTVAGVRYFNMAGQEMTEANGMTIVVTTYTDGTTSAVKVMK